MTKKSVLAIGIDPAFGDFAKFPQHTAELVRAYIDAELQRLCFNSNPADTIDAVRRWTHPGGPK